jgi:hypothetical protein
MFKKITRVLMLISMVSISSVAWSQTVDNDNDGYDVSVDCDDNNAAVNPGASEVCNSIDDDCNGLADDGLTFTTYYADVDGDGFGASSDPGQSFCSTPSFQYAIIGGDCEDFDNSINPSATEVCNLVDDDCDGIDDEGVTTVYYADSDGDTYGDASSTIDACSPLSGYVSDATDCNDANAAVNPAATEVCNTIDDDCDGLTDEDQSLTTGAMSGASDYCVPQTYGFATFSVAAVDGATTYTWTLPSGMSVLQGQGSATMSGFWTTNAAHAGIKGNVCVVASNACVSAVPVCKSINVQTTAPGRPGSIVGAGKLCPGSNATYSISAIAKASSYSWTLPTGLSITSGAGTNSINVTADNSYIGGVVSVVAVNGCGNSAIRTKTLYLNPISTPGIITGTNSGLCGASAVNYSTTGSLSASSYNWTVPSGAVISSGQGTNAIQVDFSGATGGGNVSVQAINGCGTSANRNLAVKLTPGQPSLISGPLSNCPGSVANYSVGAVPSATGYNWIVPGTASITGGQGTNAISVQWGLTEASGLTIRVIPSNACGNGTQRVQNGISVANAACARLVSGTINNLSVYPNPAQEMAIVSFTMEDASPAVVQIADVTGRIVSTTSYDLMAGTHQLNLGVEELAAGLYTVSVVTSEKQSSLRLIID